MKKVVFEVNGIRCEGVIEKGLIYTRSKIYKADSPQVKIIKKDEATEK